MRALAIDQLPDFAWHETLGEVGGAAVVNVVEHARRPRWTTVRVYRRLDIERGRYTITARNVGSFDPSRDGLIEIERKYFGDMTPWPSV